MSLMGLRLTHIYKALRYVPPFNCLLYFSLASHWAALKKFFVLWILTSLPILIAALLTSAPNGDVGMLISLYGKLKEAVSTSELFVYAATFITPLFYVCYEKYQNSSKSYQDGRLVEVGFRRSLFDGYFLLFFLSIIAWAITSLAFGLVKTESEKLDSSYLGVFLGENAVLIYFFSLFCWYMSLIDGVYVGDFVSENRKSEKNIVKDFSARVADSGVGNE